jgi:hypothetical protein
MCVVVSTLHVLRAAVCRCAACSASQSMRVWFVALLCFHLADSSASRQLCCVLQQKKPAAANQSTPNPRLVCACMHKAPSRCARASPCYYVLVALAFFHSTYGDAAAVFVNATQRAHQQPRHACAAADWACRRASTQPHLLVQTSPVLTAPHARSSALCGVLCVLVVESQCACVEWRHGAGPEAWDRVSTACWRCAGGRGGGAAVSERRQPWAAHFGAAVTSVLLLQAAASWATLPGLCCRPACGMCTIAREQCAFAGRCSFAGRATSGWRVGGMARACRGGGAVRGCVPVRVRVRVLLRTCERARRVWQRYRPAVGCWGIEHLTRHCHSLFRQRPAGGALSTV